VFHWIAAGVLAAMFLASLLGLDRWEWLTPPGVPDENTALCLMRRLTGLPCPTCGMTRSFCAMGRGEVGEAFALQPLGPVLYVVFAVVMFRSAVIAIRGRPRMDWVARALIVSIPLLAGAAAVAWCVRMWGLWASGAAAALWHASPLGWLISRITFTS
jgi:hypothetical protein